MDWVRELGPRIAVKLFLQVFLLIFALLLTNVDADALRAWVTWEHVGGIASGWLLIEWIFRTAWADSKVKEAVEEAKTARAAEKEALEKVSTVEKTAKAQQERMLTDVHAAVLSNLRVSGEQHGILIVDNGLGQIAEVRIVDPSKFKTP